MPDRDAAPDPIDKAYAQAEAVLDDDSARAARRARVLAAVAREPATPRAVSLPPIRRPAWRRGGWLVAASVAGLSVFLAVRVYPPASIQGDPTPTTLAAPVAAAPEAAAPAIAASPAPAAKASVQTPKPAPRAATPPARDVRPVEPSPTPQQVAQAPGTLPPPPPAPSQGVAEIVVTAERRAPTAAPNPGFVAPPAPASSPAIASRAGSPPDQPARLRAAAADGRTAELAALLAKGVPVDAPDADGETALMKSIQADHPATAALLRRHGASLDRKNRQGASARDMAAVIGDAELNQALGLDR